MDANSVSGRNEALTAAEVRFVDLVDVGGLQTLMDALYRAFGIANAIIDLDGVVITQAGWQDLCTRFHRIHPETRRRCIESDTSLASSMTRGVHFASYRCLNGLVDTASPIVVGGRHLANVFTGQFFAAAPDIEFFRRQAQQFGFDETAYLDAVARVPVIAPERAEAIMTVYAQFAQVLAANGLDRLRQREAEQELAAANRGLEQRTHELEAANKELEEFSYSVSHDLRTPLRAIDGFARILLEEYGERLDDEGGRMLHVVRDNALRMGRLIDDILRFLRLGRRRPAHGAIDMAKLARDVFDELCAATPQRRLRLELRDLPPAWGDADMVRQALLNLVSNAIKFSPAEHEAVIEVGGSCEAAENAYYVKDWGVGFDMRYAGKLFKVFERLHSTGLYEGTGIGLAIVKRVVERHGGRVWAEGAVGQGAIFRFTLPRGGPGDA